MAYAVVSKFLDWQLGACIIFIAALAAMHILMNRAVIATMDEEMKRVRGLTLLLPEEVIRGIPAIRQEVEKNTQGEDAGASSRDRDTS